LKLGSAKIYNDPPGRVSIIYTNTVITPFNLISLILCWLSRSCRKPKKSMTQDELKATAKIQQAPEVKNLQAIYPSVALSNWLKWDYVQNKQP